MLKQRVITALVLLAVLLPALFAASPWPFAALTLVMVGAAAWAWGRLNGASMGQSLLLGGVVASACGASWWFGGVGIGSHPAWWVACGVWVLGGGLALRGGPPAWPGLPRAARWS